MTPDTNQPDSGPREWWIEDNAYNRQEPIYPSAKYTHVVEHSALVKAEAERNACIKAHDENIELMKELQKLMAQAEARIIEQDKAYDWVHMLWTGACNDLKDITKIRGELRQRAEKAERERDAAVLLASRLGEELRKVSKD